MTTLDSKLRVIYRLRGEDVSKALEELTALGEVSRSELLRYKEKRIEQLITYVKKNCEYYRSFFKTAKSTPTLPTIVDSLNQFPIIDKSIIRDNLPGFICNQMRTSWRSTSGTTGTPFVFEKDRHASAYMDAMMFCAYSWHGIQPLSRQARIWGSSVDIKGKLMQKTKDLLLGRRRLSVFKMDEHNCRRFFKLLLRHKPFYFYCYPNAMYQFALSLERQGLDGKRIGASVIICTGEVLFPHQKEKIEQITGCRVVNEYGSTENGIIAFECEYGAMHLLPTVHVDIIDPDKEGVGEIAVTELNSRSIPFIKYMLGDTGKILDSGCKCKRPFEVIEIKEGRANDLIVCPGGKKVYAAILAYVLKGHAAQFKAFQEKKDLINIHIVPETTNNSQFEKKIRQKLQNYLGREMNINFTTVDNIAPENSGKLRYFVSRIT